MSRDEDLSQEDREKLARFESEFQSGFSESPTHTLEDWAFHWWESVTSVLLGENPLERAIVNFEEVACVVLSKLVDELPDGCSAGDARAWARSDEALADVLAVCPPTGGDEERGAWVLMCAVAALVYAEQVRHEVGSGETRTAAWGMFQLVSVCHSLKGEVDAPLLDKGRRWLAGTELAGVGGQAQTTSHLAR